MVKKGRRAKNKEEHEEQMDMIDEGSLGDGITDEHAPNAPATPPEVTLEQFKQRRPRTYSRALKLIAADGLSTREIARLLEVSPATIRAIRSTDVSLGAEKESQGKLFARVGRMCAERAMEKLDDDEAMRKTSLRDLLISSGVATEKSQLLLGGATSRSESATVTVDAKGFAEWQASMMGSGSGERRTKGEPAECDASVIGPDESAGQDASKGVMNP